MMVDSSSMTEAAGAGYDPRPYVRIGRDVREKLTAGVIAAGDAVPVTTLAEEWEVSPQTVRKALRVLAAEGMISHYPGCGYYAPSRVAAVSSAGGKGVTR